MYLPSHMRKAYQQNRPKLIKTLKLNLSAHMKKQKNVKIIYINPISPHTTKNKGILNIHI